MIISDDIEHYMSLKALMERTKAMQADDKFTGQESAIARVFVDTVQKQFLG